MSLADVRSALVSGFMQVSEPAGLRVSHENKKFNPPTDEAWVDLAYMPGVPVPASIGARGMDELRGYLQATINTPLDSGTETTMTLVNAIRSYFYGGRTLTYQGQEVRITSAGAKNGYPADQSHKTPVLINFYAQIQRSE